MVKRESIPPRSTWRAQVLVEARDLYTQLDWHLARADSSEGNLALAAGVRELAASASALARSRLSLVQLLTGSNVLSARQYLDAATINLLRLSRAEHLNSLIPNLAADAAESLPADDVRVRFLHSLGSSPADHLTEVERARVIAAVQASQRQNHRRQLRLRSFRNVIVGVTVMMTILGAAAGAVGFLDPTIYALCFSGDGYLACPVDSATGFDGPGAAHVAEFASRIDVLVVQFIGALAASLAAAFALKNVRGSGDPYSLPVALALLKLPTGAMTAFLGLLLLRADLVPTVTTAIDSSAQLIALALLLGYSRQLFTGLVDKQAQTVLANARDHRSTAAAFEA